jgi:hypothetical protein
MITAGPVERENGYRWKQIEIVVDQGGVNDQAGPVDPTLFAMLKPGSFPRENKTGAWLTSDFESGSHAGVVRHLGLPCGLPSGRDRGAVAVGSAGTVAFFMHSKPCAMLGLVTATDPQTCHRLREVDGGCHW